MSSPAAPPALAPLVVQRDGSLLLDLASPRAAEARDELLAFAELVKAPEHVHTYRLSPLSLWNAAAAGHDGASIVAALERHARFPVPESVRAFVLEQASRWGELRLVAEGPALRLVSTRALPRDVLALVREAPDRPPGDIPLAVPGPLVPRARRGELKAALARRGWPVRDDAGLRPGAPLEIALRDRTLSGEPFALRPYQAAAVAAVGDREGTIVLPCGAGKTVVAIAAIARARARTLVLTTGSTAVKQWRRELLERTSLAPDEVLDLAESRAPGPVTVATYALLGKESWREAVAREDWGLLVLDEVHVAPEAVLGLVARLQHVRRLGLTATLARDDGRAADVFALVGPKRFDVPWKALEREGWIAAALCTEVRLPLERDARRDYERAPRAARARLAAESPAKLTVLERLLERHPREPVLVLGSYLDQLDQAGSLANAPVVSGSSPARERERLFADFRAGKLRVLVLSKLGSHAIDLPEAAVAIQLSGTFGSSQEEAQRLGRILRPKKSGARARFYTVVAAGTVEEDHALSRQLFLTEQGYRYAVEDATPAGELAPGGGEP